MFMMFFFPSREMMGKGAEGDRLTVLSWIPRACFIAFLVGDSGAGWGQFVATPAPVAFYAIYAVV